MGQNALSHGHWYINRYHWRRVFATYCHEKWRCVGSERNVALPVRYACLIYYFHLVPFQPAGHPAQGSIAQIRPCRHLSAHCRQLFSHHASQPTRSGLLGLGNIQFCMAVCIHRNHSLLCRLKEHSYLETICYIAMDAASCCLQTFTVNHVPSLFIYWLIAEGVSYITGAVFYSFHKLPYMHSVFHLFVLGGTICHMIALWYIL